MRKTATSHATIDAVLARAAVLCAVVAGWCWLLRLQDVGQCCRCVSGLFTLSAVWAASVALLQRQAPAGATFTSWDESMALTFVAVSARLLLRLHA